MDDFEQERYKRKLHVLLRKDQIARHGNLDRWHLPPVAKGWLRGNALNIRQSEVPCEFGMLQILDFDLTADPKEPGVPVRMAGTYFTNRLIEGQVMDVPDPTPSARPITPIQIFFSHSNHDTDLKSYYPGRDAMPRGKGALLGLLAVGGPIVATLATIAVLHYWFHLY
jgi:hypothetical protein